MRNRILIFPIIAIEFMLMLTNSCKEEAIKTPTVVTFPVNDITQTTATSGGYISNDGGGSVTSCGICWSTSKTPTISDSITTDGANIGSFTSNIRNLTTDTTYYVRAYATNRIGTGYGSIMKFKTRKAILGVTTLTITDITQTSANCGGIVTADKETTIMNKGVCWNTTINPTIYDSKTTVGIGSGSYMSNITGLKNNTTYYVRAYATNSAGTEYGSNMSFTTSPGAPIVSTLTVSDITENSAKCAVKILNDGGTSITACGICWSTKENPTVSSSNSYLKENSTAFDFTSNLYPLYANTTYYVRAYATNSLGTGYGNQLIFKTASAEFTLGQSYQGGIIAYIFQSGDQGYVTGQTHGLIAAPYDQSTGIQWYNGIWGTLNVKATELGIGNSNTNAIVSAQGTGNYAAKICYDLELGGYSDWYLPSKDELSKLYLNRAVIDGFTSNSYWCSSEYNGDNAWDLYFGNGTFNPNGKSGKCYVRAVRYF